MSTRVGYTNGEIHNPSYQQVCTGTTGHTEATEVTFDPNIISFEELLSAFWLMHNPTTLNRQGPDQGTQYRSAIFYHDERQQQQALLSKQTFDDSGMFVDPIVTEISAATSFYPAEEYHQCYLEKQGLGSCH